MNTKEDIKQMMADVRRAHRLIYQYQDRMIQLMNRIALEYGLSNPSGRKRFSNAIGTMRRGNDYPEANLRVHDKWAWDMVYPYEFEYYFGKSIRSGLACCLSVFQLSNNGYYLADGHYRESKSANDHMSKRKIEDYWPSDQSSSYLIFAIECFPENEHRYFFKHPKDSIVSLYGGDTDSLIKRNNDNVLVAHRFLIEDFFSRISVNEKLIEFANIVKRETAYTLIE